ncbi:hypothetical protein GCM10023238_20850 [Streptomyces heliomycini]
MAEEACALAERWRSGEVLDVTAESFRLAVRVTARCLMRGSSMDARAERVCADLATCSAACTSAWWYRSGRFTRCRCLPTGNSIARWPICTSWSTRSSPTGGRAVQKPNDLLTALLEARDEHGDPIGEQEIHDQVIAILTPGSETVGATVMSLLLVLTEHPEVGERIREEMKTVVATAPVAFEDVHELRYTRMSSSRPCGCIRPYGY